MHDIRMEVKLFVWLAYSIMIAEYVSTVHSMMYLSANMGELME